MQYDRVFPVAMPGELHIPPFCAPQRMDVEIPAAVHIGGYRALSWLTAIAERDDHGVWRAGVGRDIDRGIGGGFAAFSGSVRRCEIGW
jgi:hypothetical protein